MPYQLAVAFFAGVVSVVTPCVLPLVPGYLSIVSAVEPERLGEPGASRRVFVGSLPFIAGFTVVFVALGVASAAIARVISPTLQNEIAGFILVVVGLAFLDVLPIPKQLVGVGLIGGARRSGSRALLGAAFATCAAPCIGPVLAGILVLAGGSSEVVKGAVLLFAYSIGLGAAFLLAGVSFAKAMGAFRWLRDHYRLISAAGGVLLVALGLLLFFDRFWWLRAGFNHVLNWFGLGA
jgi:cytochrome c-type biogenesis protein